MNELVKFMAKESECVYECESGLEKESTIVCYGAFFFFCVALVFLVCYLHCLVWFTFGFFPCLVYFRLYFSVSGFLSVSLCVCVTSVSVGQCHQRRLVIIIVIVIVFCICIIVFTCCARYLINT